MTRGEEIVASWGTDMKRAVCIEQIDAAIEARVKPLREAINRAVGLLGHDRDFSNDSIKAFIILDKALTADRGAV